MPKDFITRYEIDEMAYRLDLTWQEVLLNVYHSELNEELSHVCEKLACLLTRGQA